MGQGTEISMSGAARLVAEAPVSLPLRRSILCLGVER